MEYVTLERQVRVTLRNLDPDTRCYAQPDLRETLVDDDVDVQVAELRVRGGHDWCSAARTPGDVPGGDFVVPTDPMRVAPSGTAMVDESLETIETTRDTHRIGLS